MQTFQKGTNSVHEQVLHDLSLEVKMSAKLHSKISIVENQNQCNHSLHIHYQPCVITRFIYITNPVILNVAVEL